MKFIVGCLAFIGCLTLLMVVGCMGCAGLMVANLPEIPPYATSSHIESTYKKDLDILKKYLETNDATLVNQLSSDIYALYLDDDELLKRHHIDGKSYYMSNGAGAGTLRIDGQEIICMIYRIKHDEEDYTVYIYDKTAMKKDALPGGPEAASPAPDSPKPEDTSEAP